MSDEQQDTVHLPVPSGDLIPGMVTVVEETRPEVVVDLSAAPVHAAAAQTVSHFDVVLRGYERHQVDGHLRELTGLVDQLRAELADVTHRESSASGELERMRGDLDRGRPSFDALGERVAQMLSLAESEAAQLRADAEQDTAALRHAAGREAADIRSDARREAEELGAAARAEVADLGEQRVTLLTEIAAMRDTLNTILASSFEQWPSLAATDEALGEETRGDKT